MLKEKIILESFQEKKKVRSDFFFQTGRRFNIFITLTATAEVIPGRVPDEYTRARGCVI